MLPVIIVELGSSQKPQTTAQERISGDPIESFEEPANSRAETQNDRPVRQNGKRPFLAVGSGGRRDTDFDKVFEAAGVDRCIEKIAARPS